MEKHILGRIVLYDDELLKRLSFFSNHLHK
jgi:hypothetical protein